MTVNKEPLGTVREPCDVDPCNSISRQTLQILERVKFEILGVNIKVVEIKKYAAVRFFCNGANEVGIG